MPSCHDNIVLRLLREIRAEQDKHRALLLQTIEYMRKMEQRLDAHIIAMRDELEIVIKAELMGWLAHFETRMEQRFVERDT